jgi:hypothetical protein
MNHDRHDLPRLAPDDPRLSEWLDGRLTAAEAAEIERLVAAAPELTRLVEDLRSLRGTLGAVPVTPPPPGFVRDVLAAVEAAGAEAADEAEVEEEWRRIERERLEDEIAEAREDAAEPASEPMRQRWPWLALAGALAAGVLVTVALNRPGGLADREVALVEPGRPHGETQAKRLAESAPREIDARVAAGDRDRGASAGENREKLARSADGNAAGQMRNRSALDGASGPSGDPSAAVAAKQEGLWQADASLAKADLDKGSAKPGAGGGIGGGGGGGVSTAASEGSLAAARPSDGELLAAAAPPAAALSGKPQVRTVTYRIRTAADRQRLDDLLAADDDASGKLQERGTEQAKVPAARGGAETEAQNAFGNDGRRLMRRRFSVQQLPNDPAGPVTERIAIAGTAEAMTRLAAALEAGPAPRDGAEEKQDGRGEGKSGLEAAHEADIDRAAVAQPQGSQAAPNVPGGDGGLASRAPGEAGARGSPAAPREAEASGGSKPAGDHVAEEPEILLVIEVVDESEAAAEADRP